MTDALVCLITVPDSETGARIAKTLVEEKLATCVNIVPGLRSIYMWQGEIRDDGEVLLILKTKRSLQDRVDERLADIHPYDTYEFLALSPEYGNRRYLDWINEVTG